MMNEWSKEQLEEMFSDDVVERLAFLAGCTKHRLANDPVIPDGWIVPDEVLKKFAELIVDECMLINRQRLFPDYEGDSHRVAHNNALLCANSDLREHFGVEE